MEGILHRLVLDRVWEGLTSVRLHRLNLLRFVHPNKEDGAVLNLNNLHHRNSRDR